MASQRKKKNNDSFTSPEGIAVPVHNLGFPSSPDQK
jgi:hypothetical protein